MFQKCKVSGCEDRAEENGYCEKCITGIKRAKYMNERYDLRLKGLSDDEIERRMPISKFDMDQDEKDEEDEDE